MNRDKTRSAWEKLVERGTNNGRMEAAAEARPSSRMRTTSFPFISSAAPAPERANELPLPAQVLDTSLPIVSPVRLHPGFVRRGYLESYMESSRFCYSIGAVASSMVTHSAIFTRLLDGPGLLPVIRWAETKLGHCRSPTIIISTEIINNSTNSTDQSPLIDFPEWMVLAKESVEAQNAPLPAEENYPFIETKGAR